MISEAKWHGVKEATDALKHLNHKLGNSVLRSFNRKTSKDVVLPKIKNAVHSRRAKDGIKVQSVRGEKRAVMTGPVSKHYWERWLQKGTVNRTTKKGSNRGSIRENNTLEPLYEELVDPVIDYYAKNMGIFVTKTLRSKLKSVNRKLDR